MATRETQKTVTITETQEASAPKSDKLKAFLTRIQMNPEEGVEKLEGIQEMDEKLEAEAKAKALVEGYRTREKNKLKTEGQGEHKTRYDKNWSRTHGTE